MATLLTMLLILVPAPGPDEPPTGAAPTIQFLKYVDGAFEMTATVREHVPVTKKVAYTVNGKQEFRDVTSYEVIARQVRQRAMYKGVEVFNLEGKKLADADWQKALGAGATVLVTHSGELPHAAYRKLFKDGTLIVVFKPFVPMVDPVTVPTSDPRN